MIKYYESLLLYEKSILVILEAVYSSRFIKVLRPYLDVTRVTASYGTPNLVFLSCKKNVYHGLIKVVELLFCLNS